MPFLRTRSMLAGAAAALLVSMTMAPLTAQKKDDKADKKQQEADKKQQERLQRARSQELQPLVQIVNATMAGTQAVPPTDFPVAWQNDFLKASDQKTYVPFTLTIPASAVTSNSVAMYVRVVPKGAVPVAPAPADQKKDDKKPAEPAYPFEDVHFVDLKADAAGNHRFSRAFAVAAGDYDVYLALKERNKKEGAKTTLVKQTVTVPDFWSSELTTSSMILTDRMDPLASPLDRDQQVERPYALGSVEIVPALDAKFPKTDVLSLFFLVYNPTLGPDKKPNVSVEYNFYQKTGATEKYFNKTTPQDFNGETLPAEFDFAAGHQLVAGQSVPLASFPEGDYRLEVKITDKMSVKTITRNMTFTVEPS